MYSTSEEQFDWQNHEHDGQLSVDVFDVGEELLIIAPLAGVEQDSLDVSIHNDLLTIRGERPFPVDDTLLRTHHHTECFWGNFSRTIILPVDVKGDIAKAAYTNGLLTIYIPKKQADKKIAITFIDD
ncbi:Hsp20/alpha crystallin family protein [Patescibacteria group bacterium]|nr:Hsp20/alpha crystallin family protein [Patescibacteria group bacterium]MBU1721922.1 Hsp20/alpha crystallin family protein [Patescibacteria group bacterium]MBU1901215.1 Hsp20/alpha crystallin family protein [Patescibacteria group bacterium]